MANMLNNLNHLEIIEGLERASFRRQRIFRDRTDPFDELDDIEFRKRYRFSKNTTKYILKEIENDEDLCRLTRRNQSLPSHFQLLLALRYYATGGYQLTVGDTCNLHQTTVSKIVKRVSIALAKKRSKYIFMPRNAEEERLTYQKFHNIAQFPNVIGAIDCTHIAIANPGGEDSSRYINRKGWYSLNTQVVCDADMRILNIVSRWYGSTHDMRIFNESSLKAEFVAGKYSGVLLGDPGYKLFPYLMTPYKNPQSEAQRNFNKSQRATRNIIERLFGMWKRRFSCLRNVLRTKMETTFATIIAVTILHNIAVIHGEQMWDYEEPDNTDEDEAEEPHSQSTARQDVEGTLVRARITEQFQP